MVYNGNPIKMDDLVVPLFLETHICVKCNYCLSKNNWIIIFTSCLLEGLFPKCYKDHIDHQHPSTHGNTLSRFPCEEFAGHLGGHLTNSLGGFPAVG